MNTLDCTHSYAETETEGKCKGSLFSIVHQDKGKLIHSGKLLRLEGSVQCDLIILKTLARRNKGCFEAANVCPVSAPVWPLHPQAIF